MGTTFIKLGQFLATRPDIIGEELTKNLEKLQDKLPAFDTYEAKKIIKKEIGEKQFQNILELSEPIAAALCSSSFSKNKNENENKEVAIKILRPDIEKLFNEELDALMLFSLLKIHFQKQKDLNWLRLFIYYVKLQILKWIYDLKLQLQMNYMKTQETIKALMYPKSIGIIPLKKF